MSSTTSFNTHGFKTAPVSLRNSLGSAFTPDASHVYLIKAIRLTNVTASTVTVDIKFYAGALASEFWLAKATSIGAGASVDVLVNSPIVVNGDDGDQLRMQASVDVSVDALITFMELGRTKGF